MCRDKNEKGINQPRRIMLFRIDSCCLASRPKERIREESYESEEIMDYYPDANQIQLNHLYVKLSDSKEKQYMLERKE